jgi:hypothetical protein
MMHDEAEQVSAIATKITNMLHREEGQQWEWAAVAVQAPNEEILRKAAEEAGFFETHSWATLKQWRLVGLAWPPERREPTTSFTAHAELASVQPDAKRWALMEPKLSKRKARVLAGGRPMKDDGDVGLERVLDDEANEEAILDRALEISARRNELVLGRQGHDEQLSSYLRAAGYVTTALTSLRKAIDLGRELSEHDRVIVLEQIAEVSTTAFHAPALMTSAPDTVPEDFDASLDSEEDR